MRETPDINLRLTESQNVHLLSRNTTPDTAKTRLGKMVKLKRDDRIHFRQQRGYLEKLENLKTTALDGEVSSWNNLRLQGIMAIEEHVDNTRGSMTGVEANWLTHAGTAGAGSIGAFIETIPKVLSTDDNEFTQIVVENSIRTIMKWSSFSKAADSTLTEAVMAPESGPHLTSRERYIELGFMPKYFVFNEAARVVELNIPEIDADHGKKIDKRLRGSDIIYGCPYRIHLPQMYTAMTQTAIRSGLL